MIAKRIIGCLKTTDIKVLKIKEAMFTWSGYGEEEVDGPPILWLLFQTCNSCSRVGIAELKEDLQNTTSTKFQNNIKQMTDHLKHTVKGTDT